MKIDTVIVGAGPAGLAAGAALRTEGREAVILEKSDHIGAAWHGHYDRLHLHTARGHSGLPGWPMPRDFPKYPARMHVIDYLERYALEFDLDILLGRAARRITAGDRWTVETADGPLSARNVVIAAGFAADPNMPSWPGQEGFSGHVLHSSAYRNADPYKGKRVLVVGFGNSGGEIALDLAEAGAEVALSVRGPVNVVPRDMLGVPILTMTVLQQWIPYRIADVMNRPILRAFVGDIGKLGLPKSDKGPVAQVVEDGRIPLLDVGTLAAIRRGSIAVRPGIAAFDGGEVAFADGARAEFDAVVLATGYRSDLRGLLPEAGNILDDTGRPRSSGVEAAPGLYFANYCAVPTGQLRQAGIEARAIARSIANAASAAT